MSRWVEQFKSHKVHPQLAALRTLLENASVSEEFDPAHAESFARLRKMEAFVSAQVEALDPELIGANFLDTLEPTVQSATHEVQQYLSNSNPGHLQNANYAFDGMASLLNQTPTAAFGSAKTSLTKAATAYSEAMQKYATDYSEHVTKLLEEAAAKYSKVDDRVEAADKTIAKLEARITSMESQLPTQLASYNTDFQNSEKARAEKFETWTTTYQEKLDAQFVEAAKKFGVGEDVMGQHLERAGKVLGTVVDTAQAGAYATYASEEKQSANIYRRLALGLMALAALVLFLPEVADFVRLASGYTMDWQSALYRLPFSIILLAPALYLARESSRHRTNEVANRRRQHILTTIGPYLALLEPAKADEIKAQVAKAIFSENLPVMDERTPETANFVAQIANMLSVAMKKDR